MSQAFKFAGPCVVSCTTRVSHLHADSSPTGRVARTDSKEDAMGAGRLNIEDRIGPRIAVSLALAGLEDVVDQIYELDKQYQDRRSELIRERNELVRDAAESKVAIKKLQSITGLSRARLYQLRASGADD